ncbi:FdhF/YdeP family oxidoreductase [Pontibacter sp. JAM-7]|uniref:FdhF/YdeP family oxidoreductase n=1 Tax=Pontibacter sp. JAM-7 TaxID=3366581 RepID=UPI003AF41564
MKHKKNRFSQPPYLGPAGGWGALGSTLKYLFKSEQPTINIRSLLNTNQPDGFDCPGCAWGEDKHPNRIRFCENGAKAVTWEATSKTVDQTFFARYSVGWLRQQSDYFLEYQGRLTEPMRYDPATDHYQPISWDAAIALIAKHLKQLEHPDQLELYTSGRASNEAAFLYQLFGRAFGTNNFPDCSNMCHEASGVALTESIGVGKGTVTLDDFEQANAIFVFGQNPGTNHPRMLETLRSAIKRGAQIVVFNTLKERGLERFQHPQDPVEMLTSSATRMNTLYLSPKLGGDMAAIRGLVKHLIEVDADPQRSEDVFDQVFINAFTRGATDYLNLVKHTHWSQIEEQSGLSKQDLCLAAEIFLQSPRVITTWAMGLTQHYHSVAIIQELVNLMALRGQLGLPGAGLCPVRGHSNVQGDRTMGINERPDPDFLAQLEQHFGFTVPKHNGHATVEAIAAMLEKRSKVFIGLGGNFAAATPDTQLTQQALSKCELTVQISTKLNRSHLATGKEALILPCLGRTDIDLQATGPQRVTVEDSFSMVHASGGIVEPLATTMHSEPWIIARIAQATLGEHPVPWHWLVEDYCRIRDLIAETIPGFADFNTRITEPGGFYLGNPVRQRVFNTRSGQLQIHANPLPESPLASAAIVSGPTTGFILQTLRSHDQYNTTIYGMEDRYRGVHGERKIVLINPEDLQASGFSAGQQINIRSIWNDGVTREVQGFRLIPYDIPRGNLAAYYPECNPLIPLASYGLQSLTPTAKSIAVELCEHVSPWITKSD